MAQDPPPRAMVRANPAVCGPGGRLGVLHTQTQAFVRSRDQGAQGWAFLCQSPLGRSRPCGHRVQKRPELEPLTLLQLHVFLAKKAQGDPGRPMTSLDDTCELASQGKPWGGLSWGCAQWPVWTAALPGSSSLSLRVSFQRRPAALRREPPSRDGEPAEAALGSWGGRGQARVGPRTKAAGNERHLLLSAGGSTPPWHGQEDLQPTPLDRWGVMTEQGAGPRWLPPGLEGPARTLSPPQPHPQPGSELCLAPPPRQAYLWGQAHLRDRLTCDRAPHSHRGAAAHR